EVMDERDVSWIVKRLAFGQQAETPENVFRMLVPRFGQEYLARLLVDPVVALGLRLVGLGLGSHAGQLRRQRIHAPVHLGVIFSLSRNDQRGTRLVDQNGVDFIDNGIEQPTLATILDTELHVVAQIVEAELVVRAV